MAPRARPRGPAGRRSAWCARAPDMDAPVSLPHPPLYASLVLPIAYVEGCFSDLTRFFWFAMRQVRTSSGISVATLPRCDSKKVRTFSAKHSTVNAYLVYKLTREPSVVRLHGHVAIGRLARRHRSGGSVAYGHPVGRFSRDRRGARRGGGTPAQSSGK